MVFPLGCLALAFPRLVLALVWFFGHGYLGRAYGTWVWPLLGFIFLPLTTLTFAYATHSLSQGGSVSSLGWLLTIVALLVDIGITGRSHSKYRRREEED